MRVSQFVKKYSLVNKSKGPVHRDRIDSTMKWVEYSSDLVKMTELLLVASFEEKFKLIEAMSVAERKKNWHYRQENFDLYRASFLLQRFINAD